MATKIVTMLLGLTLVLAVACGSAADPTAVPDPTATQAADTAPAAEPTAAPVVSETAQPTPTPQMAAPPPEVEVNPGKLTIMAGDLANERFDNVFPGGSVGSLNYGRVVGGMLISTNERTEMVPGIASQWDLSDDGLTWTFTIREGVKFHDGSDLTPEDVLWTFQHYFGPQAVEYNTGHPAIVSRVMERIELSGSDKVSLITKKPITHLPVIVSEAGPTWLQIIPKRDEVHNEEVELAYDNNPIGAGLMKLVKHVPASVMQFERFDDFYYQPDNGFPEDKRVNFQSLDIFLAPEESTRVSALRAGEADIVPVSLPSKQQVEAGGGRLVFGQEGVYVWGFMMGCWDIQFPCHDKRVRQALDYAIDKELIRDRLFGGPEVFQVKGWGGGVTPSTIGYSPELDPWPFDPNKARQLLADAGYPGGEGFGKLIVNTYPASSLPLQVESAQLAAEFWRRELGIDTEVRTGDSTGLGKSWRAQELKGQILWRNNETRVDTATAVITAYGDPKSDTRMHEDPELYSLTQETLQILDADEREEATKKLLLRLRDESYELGIGYANIPWGVGSRVLTWQPYPLAWYPSALHTITLR